MTAKEVYPKATVVDNEGHNVSQMENETQGIITKWKGEAKGQKNQWCLDMLRDQ